MAPTGSSSGQIRRAVPDDVIRIGQMLRRFYSSHGTPYGIKYDHGSCLSTVLKAIQEGVCLIGARSCAGALLLPFPYNREAIVAHVPFWYLEGGKEIAIFDLLVLECKRRGATHVNASALVPRHTGKRFYESRGLKLAEYQYIGAIK